MAVLPEQATAQSISALVQNALDRNRDQRPVILQAAESGSELRISVRDQGHGMPDTVLRRIAEPFFYDQGAGKRNGLGNLPRSNVCGAAWRRVRSNRFRPGHHRSARIAVKLVTSDVHVRTVKKGAFARR